MGKYEDWDLIKDLVKNINTDGYFRIWYVYVDGENGHYHIHIEIEKLAGWEGYYSDSIYNNHLSILEERIIRDVVYDLGFHRPRIIFLFKN